MLTMITTPCLPPHGKVACSSCYSVPVQIDITRQIGDGWRITVNPMTWGNQRPAVLVLGFSKGPTQAGALAHERIHERIAFKGAQGQAYKILAHLGLVPLNAQPSQAMVRLLGDTLGPFAFGSLIRCTVERWDDREGKWQGSGGGMLDRFVGTSIGDGVVTRCATRFLGHLPPETKLVIMYGLGSRLGYVDAAERVIRQVRGGQEWKRHNEISYGDAKVTFVHTEHFRSQGALLPNWLGATDSFGRFKDVARARLGQIAAVAVQRAMQTSP